ncbi:MAG: nitrate reductase [Desulfotalea sp.]|nr:MAG: nitrate reductase [Desulfotalea sp.]
MIGLGRLAEDDLPNQKNKGSHYGRYRLVVLGTAFLLLLVTPFVNYYLQQNFVQGWYQSLGIGRLWFVSPLEGLESILLSKSLYWPAIIGMLPPLLIALFLGRVFCSWLCPVTFILEIFDRLRKAFTGKKYIRNTILVAKSVLWFTLIAELLLSMVLGAPVFVVLSPPGLVGREMMMLVFFKTFAFEGVVLVLILCLELLTRRFFCRSFCPLGALLAFIGRKRSLQVTAKSANCTECGRCIRVCPMGLNPQKGEGESAYCWNCGECVDSCRFDALGFSWKKK